MNKEQALQKLEDIKIKGKPRYGDVYLIDVEFLLHTIYNDIDSRTCENCKHNEYCGVYSYISKIKHEDDNVKDFGCNKFY